MDPVKEVAAGLPSPLERISYHHNALPTLLLGIVDAVTNWQILQEFVPQPPHSSNRFQPPIITRELRVLVHALRDAEILALGDIPAPLVRNRYPVH